MLVLSVNEEEAIQIGEATISIRVKRRPGRQPHFKVGIEAPREIKIKRVPREKDVPDEE